MRERGKDMEEGVAEAGYEKNQDKNEKRYNAATARQWTSYRKLEVRDGSLNGR